jgi:predicted nucleic acid-binding protein
LRLLPDTSIWIEFFRGGTDATEELDELIERETVFLCGPILAELLAGIPPERRAAVSLALGSLRFVDLEKADWRLAGEVAYELDRRGRSVPLMDVVIAIACRRAEARLWTRDRDFDRVREAVPELDFYTGR